MDVIESIKKDKAYLKCKQIVKNWEKDFKEKFSRTPSKFDIKEAPSKIKYAYKKYFQLKSAALDSSLNICDFNEDSITTPESFQNDFIPNALSPDYEQLVQTFPDGQQLEKLIFDAQKKENVSKQENIKENLDKSVSKKENNTTKFASTLTKKLFETKKFSLRNPRKLSTQKSGTCNDSLLDQSTSFCTEDTDDAILFTSNKPISTVKNKESFDENECKSIDLNPYKGLNVRKIDESWLNRTIGLKNNEIGESKTKTNVKETFGLSNISTPIPDKPIDYIENSESETDDTVLSQIKPALKKRKLSSKTAYSVVENIDSTKKMEAMPSSESSFKPEKSMKSKRKMKRTLEPESDENTIPDVHDFVPFGIEKDVAPRLSNLEVVRKDLECIKEIKPIQRQNNSNYKLEEKIKNGTLNENFVKINIEKKIYARGKKHISYSKYKKQLWKDKKALHAGMEFPESGKIVCFKCNSSGHMARYCTAHKGDHLLPLNVNDDDDDNIPTLEDMQSFVSTTSNVAEQKPTDELIQCLYVSSQIPESFMELLNKDSHGNDNTGEIKPIYTYPQTTPDEVYEVLKKFGYNSFRPGQEQTIMRILSGKSTLLLLSTGGGKSLCYQIPAYIYSQHYRCITLVISPLVSLMEDQVISMPDFLRAGCLHTNQPPTQRQKIIQCIKDGQLNILLISPEALVAGDTSSGLSSLFKSLPPIAFACIDEAHCVSQWSHNFRPSYLMISHVLREKLNVKCILGLTATANQSTIRSIINHIDIPDGLEGVITNPSLPDNLLLSVSFEKDKDKALIAFLSSEKISAYNSIIVYCIRRDECQRIAAILRSSLQEPGKKTMLNQGKKRKQMSIIAEPYHAGMSAAQRKTIQKHFMDGTLRIIVATVAFGMGINKADIRCIIHYNMPSSFESYVQEVGRAGRDGEPAHCHVFMSHNNNDSNELLKHIHADTIDRPIIRKLIQKIFIKCDCNKQNCETELDNTNIRQCKGHEVGIPIDNTVEELDVASENISTLLCYLDLHPKKYIKLLNNSYTMCKITSYGGAKKILEAARDCPPLAMAYLLESKNRPDITNSNILEFQVIEVASAIGWDSGMVKYRLKNLEWKQDNGAPRRSQLKVEFNTLGFRVKAPGDLRPTELDNVLDDLHNMVSTQEKKKLQQLEEIRKAFSKLGINTIGNFQEEFLQEKSVELKSIINHYFKRPDILNEEMNLEKRPLDEERAISDVRSIICSYKDCTFTGRSIARIFQGIASPNYPAIVWGKCKFWRSHIHEDFYGLVRIATQQIMHLK